MFLTYSRGGHGHLFAYHLPAIELFYKQIKGFSRWSRTNLPTCFHILKNRLNEGFTVTACTVIAGGSAGAISPPSSLSVSISTTAYSGQTMCGGDSPFLQLVLFFFRAFLCSKIFEVSLLCALILATPYQRESVKSSAIAHLCCVEMNNLHTISILKSR